MECSMLPSELSQDELSWMLTLNVDALEAISQATPTPASPTWVTAPTSPTWSTPSSPNLVDVPSQIMWKGLPLMPRVKEKRDKELSKEQKARKRLARNRGYSSVHRYRQREYVQAMEARVAEMEAENAALRAQVERELCNNMQLREDLGIDSEECVWV